MKRVSLFVLAMVCLAVVKVFSQSRVVDKIKPSDFHGVYEMKGFGFFICYEHENEDVLELYDYGLTPVRRVPLGFKVKENAFMHGTSNGKIFLLTYFDVEKSRKSITAFDGKLNKTGGFAIKDNLLDIYHIDDERIGILTNKGGNNVLTIYDNTLNELKSTIFAEGYGLSTNTLEGKAEMSTISNGPNAAMFPAPHIKGYTNDSDYLILYGSKVKGLKVVSNKVFVLDKKGDMVFEYDLPVEQYMPFYVYEQGENIHAVVWEGKFDGKLKERKMTGFATLVLDRYGKLKEKIVNEMPISDLLTPMDYVVGPNGIMLTCSSMSAPDKKNGESKLFINAYTVEFHFMFLHFDNTGKLVSWRNVTKKTGSSDSPLVSNYCHTGITADGRQVYTIYYTRDEKSLMFHAAYSDQQGVSPIESDEIYTDDLDGGDEKISINWFNAFPAEPGTVVLSFYSSKKKSVILYKVDVSQLGKKPRSPVKKN